MILYDTSYLFEEVMNGKIPEGCVLDLTLYEFGNILWKNLVLKKKGSLEDVTETVNFLLDLDLEIIRVEKEDFTEILKIAVENKITVYDAAYIYVARKRGLVLKTLDKKLQKIYRSLKR